MTTRANLPPSLLTPQAEDKHVMDYIRVLYKRRWIVVPVFLIVAVVGATNTLRQTPIYQGRVQLLIEKDSPNVARLDQMFQSQDGWYNDDFYQTQFRILQSRSLAKKTIDNLNLWNAPRLGNGPEPKGSLSLTEVVTSAASAVVALAKKPLGLEEPEPAPAPPPQRVDETAAQSARIDEFLGGLTIAPVRNSRIVEVLYTSSDPAFAAQAANSLAKAYIQQTMEIKFTASKEATDWLSDRLSEQRRGVESSEASLQTFKEKNVTVSISDRASNQALQRLPNLNSACRKSKN